MLSGDKHQPLSPTQLNSRVHTTSYFYLFVFAFYFICFYMFVCMVICNNADIWQLDMHGMLNNAFAGITPSASAVFNIYTSYVCVFSEQRCYGLRWKVTRCHCGGTSPSRVSSDTCLNVTAFHNKTLPDLSGCLIIPTCLRDERIKSHLYFMMCTGSVL